jgi:DNA segregation ATPase FtsK/SpoIIIE, S-DNA-T family
MILGESNTAARLLTRPGEAIYNDNGGLPEANSPFQVAWLPDAKRERYLGRVNEKLKTDGTRRPVVPPIVFEGNAPADLSRNPFLVRPAAAAGALQAYIGDPVAIKDPTSVTFRRQSGSNMLLIGQQDEQALATLAAAAVSLATQATSEKLRFVLFDGTPADSAYAGELPTVLSALPHDTRIVDYRGVDAAINELGEDLARRQADEGEGNASIFLIVNGLQRYRSLRKGDDEFSFSMSDEPKPASPAKQLVDLIREGPSVGIHVVAWVDTLASIERTFDRGVLREFDNRILFQMSANDSSNLIDSPAANKLGFFRALAYSEEQGVMEKFRPYGLPPKAWLAELAEKMRSQTTA